MSTVRPLTPAPQSQTARPDVPRSSRRGLLGLVLGAAATTAVLAPLPAAAAGADVIDGGAP